jgi:REP element-mobilizing transposase RayT
MKFDPRKHHRRSIRLYEHEFVVMPNHLHGIVIEDQGAKGRGAMLAPLPAVPPTSHISSMPADTPASVQRAPRSLSSFITGFKASFISRATRELNMFGIWQRNYYEHIICN